MSPFYKNVIAKTTIYRSIKVALVVGTILAFINHIDAIVLGNLTKSNIIQIFITYLVPYSVATFGSASEARRMALLKDKRM